MHIDPGDTVGRYGGEEFVMLTLKTDIPTLFAFVDTIRAKIQKTTFVYQKQKINVTCSAGIAVRSSHDSQQQCMKAADAMVYKAKKAGRNQVFPKL